MCLSCLHNVLVVSLVTYLVKLLLLLLQFLLLRKGVLLEHTYILLVVVVCETVTVGGGGGYSTYQTIWGPPRGILPHARGMVFDSRLVPNEAEAEAIAALKTSIAGFTMPKQEYGPQLDDPSILLRFVRGYGLKNKDATKAFEEMLAYRAANDIDGARAAMRAAAPAGEEMAWPATDLEKFAPLRECTGGGLMKRLGKSAAGMPATLCLIHLYDVKKVMRENLTAMLVELQQWQDEWWSVHLLQESEKAGTLLARCDVVHVAELSLFHFDIGSSRTLMRVLEGSKHYPESSARIVSSGNSKPLLAMYNAVIKPFMPTHTAQKLLVLGKDLEKPSNQEAIGFDEPTFQRLLMETGRTTADKPDVMVD